MSPVIINEKKLTQIAIKEESMNEKKILPTVLFYPTKNVQKYYSSNNQNQTYNAI